MTMFSRRHPRAVLTAFAAVGLALAAAAPAAAADGTPTTPTELFSADQPCSTDANTPAFVGRNTLGVFLEGIPDVTDPAEGEPVTEQFRLWPVADPSQVTTVTHDYAVTGNENGASVPPADFTDGATYAYQGQTLVGAAASDWSATCYFTYDISAPVDPVITSSDYPENQTDPGGDPADFALSAGGADDITGYEFSWQPDLPVPVFTYGDHGIPQPDDPYTDTRYFVRADTLGGTAALHLVPPTDGPATLYVRSLDRAGNVSDTVGYSFFLKSTAPSVTPEGGDPHFGDHTTFDIAPDAGAQADSPVVSYTVTYGDIVDPDTTVTVQPAADGTAQVTVPIDGPDDEIVKVTATSANGWVTDAGEYEARYDTSPTVSSDVYAENQTSGGAGVEGTFTFTPKVPDVVSYTYSFDWGTTNVTVPADSDGSATIHWTPTQSDYLDLHVIATTADGVQTVPYDYFFGIN